MIAYNILQVILNLGLASYSFYFSVVKGNYNFSCQLVNYSDKNYGILELRCVYCYFILKIIDFMDTVSSLTLLKTFLIYFKFFSDYFYSPKEKQSSNFPPHLPSHWNKSWRISCNQICTRWSYINSRNIKFICTCDYVFLLFLNISQSKN